MNAVHLHLMLNHVAILGVLFATLILIAGFLFKSPILRRAGMLAFLISAISSAVVMNTGEGAEDSVESIAGVSKDNIEAHEESAELSIWLAGITGLLSAIGLFFFLKNRKLPGMLEVLILIGGLLATGSLMNTGLLGGKIRHTELSGSAVQNAQGVGNEQGPGEKNKDGVDD